MGMSYLLILTILLIVIWGLTLIFFSKDIFSPVSIFIAVFIFALFCAHYSQDIWGLNLSLDTFKVLLTGVLSFIIPAFIISIKYLKSDKKIPKTIEENKYIKIGLGKSFIISSVFFVLSIIYMYFLIRISGTSNILKVGSVYRNLSVISSVQIPMVARLSMIILKTISIVLVCVLVNNLFTSHKKIIDNINIIIPIMIYILLTILSGERASTLRIFAIFILSYGIFWSRKNKFKSSLSLKNIVYIGIIAIALLYSFSAIRFFVGRKSELNLFEYISLYAGGPIYNINHYVNNYRGPSFTGDSTFIGAKNNLARLGLGEVKSIHRRTVTISSRSLYLGNVYTCFYDYYNDFGLIGVIILVAIYSIFINELYYKSRYANDRKILKNIMYVFFGSTLFFCAFTEQFYTSYFSISTIESIIIIYLFYWIICAERVFQYKYKINNY